MTTTQQAQDIVAYVKAFFLKQTDGIVAALETWESTENIQSVKAVLAETQPKAKNSNKLKDPNKPKRGKSSYLFFCADERASAKIAMGEGIKANEVIAELGRRWNILKDSAEPVNIRRRAKFVQSAVDDKERYEAEMVTYVEPTSDELQLNARKPRKKSGESGKPKRGSSSYVFFCQSNREAVKEDLGGARGPDVVVELAKRWKDLKADANREDEYEEFVKMAADDKERYETEMKDYTLIHDIEKPVPKAKKRVKPAVPVSDEDESDEPAREIKEDAKKLVRKQDRKIIVPRIDLSALRAPAPPPLPPLTTPTDDDDIEAILDELIESPKPKPIKLKAKITPYRAFCNTNRTLTKEQNPEMQVTEVTAELGRQWKEFSQAQKDEWK